MAIVLVGGLPTDRDVELVLVDEQHHERAGDDDGNGLVGGAVDKAFLGEGRGSVRSVGRGKASQPSSATTWKTSCDLVGA